MKRALRVVVLGPIILIAIVAGTLVWPIIWFLCWLIDDPIEFRDILLVWKGLKEFVW